ncbi:MAG TPA: YSC84-related protein [Trinickia sp.]|jgi:lipid-binding SYLF domain-containing protein|nr:YSC84-related protein [Trinickia sp.]
MQKRNLMVKAVAAVFAGTLVLAGCTATTNKGNPVGESPGSNQSKRHEIDAAVDATLSRLYAQVPGSRELVGKARGVLVFPKVIQAGLVVGGQYGEGSLRVNGETVAYYNTVSASLGLQAGAQSKAVIFLFMTEDALSSFRSRDGWSAGGNASVAVLKMGANGAIDTTTATKPVQVIVLTNAGLMGDLSVEGTKVNRMNI